MAGNVVVRGVELIPLLRPLQLANFAVSHYAGRYIVTMRYDARHLDSHDADDVLRCYVHKITASFVAKRITWCTARVIQWIRAGALIELLHRRRPGSYSPPQYDFSSRICQTLAFSAPNSGEFGYDFRPCAVVKRARWQSSRNGG